MRLLLIALGIATTASAQLREWKDYRTILWTSGSVEKHKDQWPLIVQRLKEMGINTGMGGRDVQPQKLIDNGFGYYVENIINKGLCLKFSSNVTNWSKFIDEWSKTRSSDAFVRDYCFDDPQWLGSMTDMMSKAAAAHASGKPLMYDLRDELSVTTSANPFDYDFSPLALAGFRTWLRTQYKDLAALNAQWDTEFASWDAVMPFSTDQIKARMVTGEKHPKSAPDWSALKRIKFDPAEAAKNPIRWNFSPWCDHRTYMDISLARTLDHFRQASHAKDSATPVGIEGLQMPHAFGGYDLWRLSQVLDWCEPYDVANSREILGSFMPGKPMVCTVFEKDTDHARRRLWHLLLLGDRGCIVWWSEDVIDWTKPDLPLSDKGKALAPALKEMCSPLAKLFIMAKREVDPIAIHYSQPSIQVAWLLESTADGQTWPRRFSSFEGTHNKNAQARNLWLKALQDAGLSPIFLSSDQVERNAPEWQGIRGLVLPESRAMNKSEASRIDGFVQGGQHFVAGFGLSGGFDAHGKWTGTSVERRWNFREKGATGVLAYAGADGGPIAGALPFEKYDAARLQPAEPSKDDQSIVAGMHMLLSDLLERAGIRPPVHVPIEARVRTHRFTLGKVRLLAFERNIDYKMSEDLAQAGGNEQLEKPVIFTASWDGEKHITDLRTGKSLGKATSIEVHLDPWQPALYALTDEPLNHDPVEALLQQAP